MSTSSLAPPASKNPKPNEGKLRRLLNEHAYAMDLIKTQCRGNWNRRWCLALIERLSSTPSGRSELVLQAVLREFLSGDEEKTEEYFDLLCVAALLTTPVPVAVFCACLDRTEDAVKPQLESLRKNRLLLGIGGKPRRYTAHTVLRDYILHSLGERPSLPGEHHIFELGAFHQDSRTSRLSSLRASRNAANYVDRLLASLPNFGGKSLRHLTRSAFGLLRANWSATGVAGLPGVADPDSGGSQNEERSAMERYLVRLAGLLNAVHKDKDNHVVDERRQRDNAHLYADELGWIYNELGWAFFCHGSLADAWIHFWAFKELSEAIERSDQRGHRTCRAHLNLAHWFIERASLHRARQHVEKALGRARDLEDPDAEAQGLLLQGLIHHLSGELSKGQDAYSASINLFLCTENRRGLSAAYRHLGDLRRVRGSDQKKAEQNLHESRVIAEAGGHGDLYWFSRVAHCYFRASGNDLTGQDTLEHAMEFARRTGLRSLEADVQKVQASIALKRGDLSLAEQLVFENLSICAAMGMRLRKTSALVLLGQVASKQQNHTLARHVLNMAVRIGQQQGYSLQVEGARRKLISLGSDSN